jgi:hypothetical protein
MTRPARLAKPERGAAVHARPAGHLRAGGGGLVLVEVVLAVTLFFCGALVVLTGLSASLHTANRVRTEADGADLAVTLLSEVQMGLVPLVDDGPNEYEEEELADWTWEIVTSDVETRTEAPPLVRVEIIIHNARENCTCRLVQLFPEPQEEEAEGASGGLAPAPERGGP